MYRSILVLFCMIAFFANGQPKGFKLITDEASFKKKFAEAANSMKSIKSDFVQEKNLSVVSEKIISKGEFFFKKQNMVRMEYTSPFKYLLVINGDKVTVRDAQKTNRFSSKSNKLFEQINKIIIDCVQGTMIDNENFNVKVYENEKQYLFTLSPVKKNLREFFSVISLNIDKKDYSVIKMDMAEASGDNTVITFLNKQLNINIPDAVFVVK